MRALNTMICAAAVLATSLAPEAGVFVSPAGKGAKNGSSPENAYDISKLSSAISQAAPGDTVFLEPGSYSANIALSGSGVAGKPKVLKGRLKTEPPTISGVSGRAITISGVDPQGIVSFTVGTGGTGSYSAGSTDALLVKTAGGVMRGALKLALRANSYTYQFKPIPGKTLVDSGTVTFTTNPTATVRLDRHASYTASASDGLFTLQGSKLPLSFENTGVLMTTVSRNSKVFCSLPGRARTKR